MKKTVDSQDLKMKAMLPSSPPSDYGKNFIEAWSFFKITIKKKIQYLKKEA